MKLLRRKKRYELRKASSNSDGVLLATDPDREGEAIAYHFSEVLGLEKPYSLQ